MPDLPGSRAQDIQEADPANDYFGDDLNDELIRNLSIIDGLTVRSRTSSFGLKEKPRNIRDAGQQLQADYILEGSVLRAGRQLRIGVQLVRVRDDFPLWSGRFERELTDVFAIQDEIALGIVNNLRLKLGGGRRRYETILKLTIFTSERGRCRISALTAGLGTLLVFISK